MSFSVLTEDLADYFATVDSDEFLVAMVRVVEAVLIDSQCV